MKKNNLPALLLLLIITGSIMTGCSKKGHDPQPQLSDDIHAMVPQYILDSVRKYGFIIHDGMKPPDLEGIFLISPTYCTYDNSGDGDAGDLFDDYKYKFYNQDNQHLTLKIDFKDVGSTADEGKGEGAFLAGSGNNFSIFSELKATDQGVSYTKIEIYSGTMTSTGIRNFQQAFYLKSKGADPDHKMMEVGSLRLFRDKDGVAEKVNTY